MKKILIVLSIAIQSIVLGQSVVFPLQVGNYWQFSYPLIGEKIPAAPLSIINDTVMANGKKYSMIINNDSSGIYYQRQSGDSVYAFVTNFNTEIVLYRFDAKENDTISSSVFGLDTVDILLIDTTAYELFGYQRRIFRFRVDLRRTIDDEWITTIADSLGVIGMSKSVEQYCAIQGAFIHGKKYGTITSVVSNHHSIPKMFTVYQNYPNPFNPQTKIPFHLIHSDFVQITIYNMLGQEIVELYNGYLQAGEHTLTFDASHFPSGVYYYRVNIHNKSHIKKMILQK